MRFLKTTLPLVLAFLLGVVGIAVFFSPHPVAEGVKTEISVWGRYIGIVTMFIGLYSILRLHANRVRRTHRGWGYSGLFLVAFVIVAAAGMYNSGHGPLAPRDDKNNYDLVSWSFDWIQAPASSTMFSILGFFICSAAYRTFRAKTLEAAVLLIAALVVMLGQIPLAASISKGIPWLSNWLMDTPNMAVKRAIGFGICLGTVGTALRVMFGIERSYLGGDK